MREGGADSGLGQRPLGAETRRVGFRIWWCSRFVLGVGPVGEGGSPDSGLRQRPLGAKTRREGLRYLWCSCIELGGGPLGKGGKGRLRAWAKASWGRDREGGL